MSVSEDGYEYLIFKRVILNRFPWSGNLVSTSPVFAYYADFYTASDRKAVMLVPLTVDQIVLNDSINSFGMYVVDEATGYDFLQWSDDNPLNDCKSIFQCWGTKVYLEHALSKQHDRKFYFITS